MQAPGTPQESPNPRVINRGNVVDPSILLIASKERIKHVLRKIDPEQRLDADVEDILMDLTWDFINNVSNSAAKLAKHRQSDTVEACDAQLIVEKHYNIRIPGFGVEVVQEPVKKQRGTEEHQSNVAIVREQVRKAGVLKRSARNREKKKLA